MFGWISLANTLLFNYHSPDLDKIIVNKTIESVNYIKLKFNFLKIECLVTTNDNTLYL